MSSQPRPMGIAEQLSGAFAGARGLLSNLLDLFTLEARRAGLDKVAARRGGGCRVGPDCVSGVTCLVWTLGIRRHTRPPGEVKGRDA